MGATYLIDGYNLMHAIGFLYGRLGPGGLQKARMRLLGLLQGSFGQDSNAVTVVFDAAMATPGAEREQFYRGVRTLFALDREEADDVIERLIHQAAAPKTLYVVSDDRRVRQAAGRRRCIALACDEFMQLLVRMRRDQQVQSPRTEKREQRLSEEEKRRWLAEFSDVEKDPSLQGAFEKLDFEED
jgi:predicted RNA-binding protein with PIN domain